MAKTTKNGKPRLELRAVIYPEGGLWFAHCLELDIVAEGKTPQAATNNLSDLIVLQVETAIAERDLKSIFRPAPADIWSMYFSATKSRLKTKLPEHVDRLEVRELALV